VRAPRGVQVIPVLYDLILWSSGRIAAFPRAHRFTVGDRMMSAQLDILGDLITAQYEPGERKRVLRRANLTLERLRYL